MYKYIYLWLNNNNHTYYMRLLNHENDNYYVGYVNQYNHTLVFFQKIIIERKFSYFSPQYLRKKTIRAFISFLEDKL